MPVTSPAVTVKPVGDITLVTVRGPLKLGHPPLDELKDTFRHLADSGQVDVVVDLSGMPAFDSTGIGVLVLGYTSMRRRSGTVKLCTLAKLARQMLKTVGLLAVFEVFETREQALASFHL
jgi:anti-sigma B factor antagonist